MTIEGTIAWLMIIPYAYVLVRVMAAAYFHARTDYNRKIIRELNKGDVRP